MSDPLISIIGPYLANKGDALMVEAVKQQIGARSYLYLCDEWLPRTPRVVRRAGVNPAHFLPSPIRRRFGFVASGKMTAVLDNSGFQYGDQWAALIPQLDSRVEYYARERAQGAKIILLPQALGPFETAPARDFMGRLIATTDLIIARDRFSHQHLLEAGCPAEKAALAPDFSVLVKGVPPADATAWKSRVCIVPNKRMTDRTAPAIAAAYHGFLVSCMAQVRARGLEPVILVHEKHDAAFADSLRVAAGGNVQVLDESPVRSKGLLGACHTVIGSRFHSLIGSLSQGVPTLGTVWTHKYQALFDEYDAPDCLLHNLADPAVVAEKLAFIFDENSRRTLIPKLQTAAARHKDRVRQMWARLEQMIFA